MKRWKPPSALTLQPITGKSTGHFCAETANPKIAQPTASIPAQAFEHILAGSEGDASHVKGNKPSNVPILARAGLLPQSGWFVDI